MSKKIFDLYGINAKDINSAKDLVERALGIGLSAHESGYRGGNYFRLNDVGGEHFILQRNFDPFDGEWAEDKYREVPYLLYVNETTRSEWIRSALEQDKGATRLRHQEVTSASGSATSKGQST